MKTFRAPCGAAGLYDRSTVIEAYCGAAGTAATNCAQCAKKACCEYMSVLDGMPYGFLWEAVCGWEEAEDKETEYDC